LHSHSAKSDRRLGVVTVASFVLGMAAALAVCLLWRAHAVGLSAAALAVCPPFILSYVVNATPDSVFALILGWGTILFANGCLYAGVAAGIYAVVKVLKKRKR